MASTDLALQAILYGTSSYALWFKGIYIKKELFVCCIIIITAYFFADSMRDGKWVEQKTKEREEKKKKTKTTTATY